VKELVIVNQRRHQDMTADSPTTKVRRSIITMRYPKSGRLPERIKAIVNLPLVEPVSLVVRVDSMKLKRSDLGLVQADQVHAHVALQLAHQMAWLGEDDDLIPATLHRIKTLSKGRDVMVWVVNSDTSITAKKIIERVVG